MNKKRARKRVECFLLFIPYPSALIPLFGCDGAALSVTIGDSWDGAGVGCRGWLRAKSA
ncbi:MAG TPA: hypothetical protein VJ842_11895 [Pyrinomonadaceae bacterium]|nr:hypothetical protein [Pyrinomonadaceae bacterium]